MFDASVSARGIDWARPGNESAVISISVDGRKATDLLAFGREPIERTVALGRVRKGRHVIGCG